MKTYPNQRTFSTPFGMLVHERVYIAEEYRFGFNGKEKDDEVKGTGNSLDFGARIYDNRLGRWLSVDPLWQLYLSWNPYHFGLCNPIVNIDQDGKEVIPTNAVINSKTLSSALKLASENSVFQNTLKNFYSNQQNLWVHAKEYQGDWKMGAISEAPHHNSLNVFRITINTNWLDAKGELAIDETVFFMTLLHEAMHERMFFRYTYNKYTLDRDFPGDYDFLQRTGDHHEQMALFGRDELIKGMKEFDASKRERGESVPDSHTNEWYNAMSWLGLRDTEAWKQFKQSNPEQAESISKIIDYEMNKVKDAYDNKNTPTDEQKDLTITEENEGKVDE